MVNLKLIKLLCAERNISLRELAKQVNISEVGLQRIIRTNSTKVETLEKIADVLNVEISRFFPTTKTHKSFLDNNEFEFIKTLSKRYDKFSDQISFFKDYFVTVVMRGIDKGYKPKYPEEYPSPTGLLINDDQMNR